MKNRTRVVLAVVLTIAAAAALGLSVPLLAAGPAETLQGRSPVAELCDSKRFPSTQQKAAQCCQDGNRTWHKLSTAETVVFRSYGAPCREEDGVGTNCGVGTNPFKPCAYGPCGAKNEWAIHGVSAHIFHPTSQSKKCGWSVQNILDFPLCTDPGGCGKLGGTRDSPESYTTQTVYAGVTGSCPYTRCLKGGTPALPAP